jgi:transaldolase/glucose-6-phosphate isomerase
VRTTSVEDREGLGKCLDRWLDGAGDGDYISIQAYLEPGPKTDMSLGRVREILLTRTHLATTLGYGPQFLHSTGQLHKGGPNTGLFLQIVDEVEEDLTIPGQNRSFQEVISAQSVGDFMALEQRGRRVVRINLGSEVEDGLRAISIALESR